MPDGQDPHPADTGTKQAGGRFPPGRSGNPSGRRPGSRNRVLIALDAIGAASAAGVLQAAIKGALSGDTRAQELILSRVWPARRDRPVSLVLPPIATAGDVMQAMAAVTSAIAAGQVTPGEGQAISTVLAAARQAIETTELADRISRLEAAQPHDEGRDP